MHFLILLISFLSIESQAGPIGFKDVLHRILRPLKECPEKVWPQYYPNLSGKIAISYPSENKSFLIQEDFTIKEVATEELGEPALTEFSFEELDGKKLVLFNWESDWGNEDLKYRSLFHEAFHHLGQDGRTPQTDRSELMPMDFEGRVARAMQIRNIRAYLQSKSPTDLKHASYWEN